MVNRIIFSLLFIFAFFFQRVNAQALLTIQDVSLKLTNATVTLYVYGDINNTGVGSIDNSGTIQMTGNWFNNTTNNVFGTSAGIVVMSGPNIVLGGSKSTTFNTLVLVGGTKTLLQAESVGGAYATPSGFLALNAGVKVDLNSKVLTITNSAPSGISTSGTSDMILAEDTDFTSRVNWNIGSALGTHVIPFGTVGFAQIPFTYTHSGGNSGEISASTYPTNALNLPLPYTPILVHHIRNLLGVNNNANMIDRFWFLSRNTTTSTATLGFSYDVSEVAANGNTNIRAQRWNVPNDGWQAFLPGQSNPTATSVNTPSASNYGIWALTQEVAPLPVELINFSVDNINNSDALCRWTTASETNNKLWIVEKSRDGIHFGNPVEIAGQGTVHTITDYNYTDENPFAGISYYRLSQLDFDGQVHSCGIKSVRFDKAPYNTEVYPIPASDIIYIKSNNNLANSDLSIFNSLGSLIYNQKVNENYGENMLSINTQTLSNGIYYLLINDGFKIEKLSFIINK